MEEMIFVVDIGNTNTVLGVYGKEKLIYEWRIRTDRYRTEDELATLIKSLFADRDLVLSDITGIIISSVVPPIMRAIEMMCEKYFQITPYIVGKDHTKHGLHISYPAPKELGADRIVNAVGALTKHQAPCIIIDFGTATTFCYVDEHASYHGGVIVPGIKISMDALYAHASKLPKIEIEKPMQTIGQSTVEAMQSGAYYGYIGQVDGIVDRMQAETGRKAKVIATGGLASLIARDSATIDVIEPNLTLIGLYEIYQRNKK